MYRLRQQPIPRGAILCSGCNGAGGREVTGSRVCTQCHGSGLQYGMFAMLDSPDVKCSKCRGDGNENYLEWETCKQCGGARYYVH
jgi:DnaJ-class molecular chaperone